MPAVISIPKQFGVQMVEHGYAVQLSPQWSKHPVEASWQDKPKSIEELELAPATAGVNLLFKHCKENVIALDCDLLSERLSEAFRLCLYKEYPALFDLPVRVGRAPKWMIICRCSARIGKVTSKSYTALSAEELAAARKQGGHIDAERLEILGASCQALVFGWHPETRKCYEWKVDSPFALGQTIADIYAQDLPVLTPDDLRGIIRIFEEMVSAEPAYSLLSSGGAISAELATQEDELAEVLSDKAPLPGMTPDRVRELISRAKWDVDTRESWVQLGAMLAHQYRDAPEIGLQLFDEASRKSPKYKGIDDVRRTYESLRRNTGGRAVTLRTLIKAVRSLGAEDLALRAEEPTSEGLAAKVRLELADEIYYLGDEGRALHWNGMRYVEDDVGEIDGASAPEEKPRTNLHAMAYKIMAAHTRRHLPPMPQDAKAERAYAKDPWVKLHNRIVNQPGFVRGVLTEYILKDPAIRRQSSDFDQTPGVLSVANGYIDLKTGMFFGPDKELRLRRHTNVRFDPDAKCPMWERFIEQASAGDPEFAKYLQRYAGYILFGSPEEQLLHIFVGSGGNGKSVYCDVLKDVLGEYAIAIEKGTLVFTARSIARSAGGAQPDLARLNGCRLAICAELDDGDRLRAGEIKALTGEQTFTARRLYAEYTTFKTTWNILLQTNVMPRCADLSEGMGRRLRIVRFNYRVTEEERDPQLVKKILAAESSGVLNWMLAGSRDYLAVGLKPTAAMRRELEHYRADLDVVAEWVSACCEPITNDEYELCLKSRQKTKEFWLSWKAFIQDRFVPDSLRYDQASFTRYLREKKGFELRSGGKGLKNVANYKLREGTDDEE